MNDKLRQSGIDFIGDVPWGIHFCQFYQTKEDLTDILVPYFKAGLENNEFCLWVTSYPLEVEEAKEALKEAVSDIDVHLEKGQIEIIPYTDWYIKDGVFNSERVLNVWIEKLDQVLANGYGYEGLRMAGNTSWLKKGNWDDFVNYEKKIDRIIGKYQMISLCTYSLDRCKSTEITEVVSNHQFSLIKKEGKWERIENSGRKNRTGCKRTEEVLPQNEQRIRLKSESTLSPARETVNLELADIVDAQAIQSLMDDFYNFAHIAMTLVDLKGNVLVSVGWQDICIKFHRVHPETCKHCVESDTKLSSGISPGEFNLYKCKNNMWDISTPVMVSGKRVGNIFSGQFFFEGEPLDYELFRSQARKYGFNEEEYIAALEKVPRLSPTVVDTCMAFFMTLANMLSQLSYSNLKLVKSLAERDDLVDALRESEERFRVLVTASSEMVYRVSPDWSEMLYLYGRGFLANTESPNRTWLQEYVLPEDQQQVTAVINEAIRTKSTYQMEHRVRLSDGSLGWIFSRAVPMLDANGEIVEWFGAASDITERKKVEEALRESEERLRLLGDNLPDSAVYQYVHELDGSVRFLYFSTGIERLNGVSVQDVLRDPDTLYRQVPQTYLERVFEAEARSARELSDFDMEVPMWLPDGQVRWMRLKSRPCRLPDGQIIWSGVQIDITEHKQAEEALKKAHDNLEEKVKERTAELEKAYNSLKESERGLAEAQKMAHIGNWNNDLLIGKLHWSEEMYRIFGFSPQECITYDKFLSCVHPEDRDYVYNSTKEAFNGKVYATDYRIVRPDGEERIVHSEREVIFDERNNPVRMRGTVQDITEHKKSEEKIRSLANIVESSNDAIGAMSLDNIITSWNEEAEQVYGYSAEEILGKHTSILAPSHLDKETGKLSEMIKQGKKIRHHETSRLRKDGKIIDVSITLSPVFDSHGKLTAISFISRDITERKIVDEKLRESEEKYRNIVETANEGIWILDAETRTTYVNEKMAKILGYSQEEMIGRSVLDFADEEGKTNLKLSLERRRKGVNESHELKLIRKDGSYSWVLVNAKSLLDKDGKFMGSMGMLTDITERKKAEEALKNIEIARKQEIHHRIKNNLQVISSLLDLQAEKFNTREDIKDSEVLEAFRESQDRVMSIALIHEELHEGGGENTLYFSPYLEKLVENLFQTYRLGNADICLNMDLEENIFFDMDIAVPLGIIVNELVSNSLKHAFPGRNRGEIRIKLFKEKKAGNSLSNDKKELTAKSTGYTLIISDNGIGIPEKIDLENSDTLGLQLVNTLVDQLDGEIEVKKDRGTEFNIRINV